MTDGIGQQVDYWNCEECQISELESWEATAHENASGHTVVPVYA